MKNLFHAAIYRLSKTTGVLVAVALTCLASVFYYVLADMIQKGTLDAVQAGSVTALGDAMVIWLFGSLVTGLLIGNDFDNKTIHGAMDYGRKKIILNYVLVFSVLILILTLPYMLGSVVCIIAGNTMEGAEGAVISNYLGNVVLYDENTSVCKLILSYVAAACVYIGQLSICLPVAVKLKKTVVVTAFGFFFGMMTALISTLASKVKILDNIYQLTPYDYGMDKIGINASIGDMLLAIVVSVIFTAAMGGVSYLLFRKSDMK